MKHEIRIGDEPDRESAEEFVGWLRQQGYLAEVYCGAEDFVDGSCTAVDPDAEQVLTGLWMAYVQSWSS